MIVTIQNPMMGFTHPVHAVSVRGDTLTLEGPVNIRVEIRLTGKDRAMLMQLLRAAGEVIEAEYVFPKLLGGDDAGNSH